MSAEQWANDPRNGRLRDDMSVTFSPDLRHVTLGTRQTMPALTTVPTFPRVLPGGTGWGSGCETDNEIDEFGFHRGTLERVTKLEKGENPYYTQEGPWETLIRDRIRNYDAWRGRSVSPGTTTPPPLPTRFTPGSSVPEMTETAPPSTTPTAPDTGRETETQAAGTAETVNGMTPGQATGRYKSMYRPTNNEEAEFLTKLTEINDKSAVSGRMSYDGIDTTGTTLENTFTDLDTASRYLASVGAESNVATVHGALRDVASLWTLTATEEGFTAEKNTLLSNLDTLWTNLRETVDASDDMSADDRDHIRAAAEGVRTASAYLNSQTW
jgi:hypothetical protein